ncbi:MAG: hypothetical protein ABFE01_17095 [Phycisphaerales bacterium]
MRMVVKGLGLLALVGGQVGLSGCYGSAMSLAKCTAKEKRTDSLERDFAPGSTLRVRNDFGPIFITGGSDEGCQIEGRVYVHAPTKREAEEIGEQVQIVAEPNDGVLLVKVIRPELKENRSAGVDLRIVVPTKANVDCETEFGRIKVDGIEGDIRVSTQFGAITCDKIVSGSITARTEFGAIYVTCEDASPADLVADVQTEYGKIRFRAPEAFDGSFDIGTDFGSTGAKIPIVSNSQWTHDRKVATTGEGKGRVTLRTEFGSVKLR